jgi:hypothetical protein
MRVRQLSVARRMPTAKPAEQPAEAQQLARLKPEAAGFLADKGLRTVYLVGDVKGEIFVGRNPGRAM